MQTRTSDLCGDCSHGEALKEWPGYYKCSILERRPIEPLSHCLFYAGDRLSVDVVIVTATSVEFNTVLEELHPAGLKAWDSICPPEDHNWRICTYQSHSDQNASVRLALTVLEAPGLVAAASTTALAVQLFRPSHVVMVGITAGREGEVHIGDIIAPRELWDYGAGKWEEDKTSGRLIFRPRPIPKHMDSHVNQWCFRLGADQGYYRKIRDAWAERYPDAQFTVPKVHNGPMVSGAAVVNAEAIWQQVLEQNNKILALDMEAYGVLYAVIGARAPLYTPSCAIMKSVCDYGVDKNDLAQSYAAFTSVKFFQKYLEDFIINSEYKYRPIRLNI